jgi:uncharacterized Zn finger protein (UPF0148 family)
MAITDMRCPNCGAPLTSATVRTGILECAYCGSHVHLTGEAGTALASAAKNQANASLQDMQTAFSALEKQVVSLAEQRNEAYKAWKAQQRAPKGGQSGCLFWLAGGLLLFGLCALTAASETSSPAGSVLMGLAFLASGGFLLFLGIRANSQRTKAHRAAEQALLARVKDLDTQIEATKQKARGIRGRLNAAIDQL